MVYLSRIYTKTGDNGETSLGDMSRVPKDHIRVCAYGDVDELNSVLGLALLDPNLPDRGLIQSIQNDLFDLGADLCVPILEENSTKEELRITDHQVDRLEKAIDRHNESLQPLRSFILPGGSASSAWLHLARTICRRAERTVVTLSHHANINPLTIIYLNRLSDLLFVVARIANDNGSRDVLWQPGQSR